MGFCREENFQVKVFYFFTAFASFSRLFSSNKAKALSLNFRRPHDRSFFFPQFLVLSGRRFVPVLPQRSLPYLQSIGAVGYLQRT